MEDTAYFACPKEAIGPLNDALTALEEQGEFEKGFCANRTSTCFLWLGAAANQVLQPTAVAILVLRDILLPARPPLLSASL